MATLQQVIDQIQTQVRAVTGIRKAPDEPPEQLNYFPFAVCYARTGELRIGPPDLLHGVHEIWLEIHVARKDLARDVTAVMPYGDSVPDAIFGAYADGTFTTMDAMGNIAYSFGPMAWGGVDTIGWRFRLQGVKVQNAIS